MALTKLTKNLIDGTFGTEWVSTIQTSNFTAEAAKGYFVNTTSAEITVTLPAGVVGNEVIIQDYAGTFATNKVIFASNGSEKIQGVTDDFKCEINNATVTLIYQDATKGWTANNIIINTVPLIVNYLVVAGGGGTRADSPGGGGAGGLRTSYGSITGGGGSAETPITFSLATNYPLTVGGGGASGASGNNSIFSTITSTAGGRGGGAPTNSNYPGADGGSGGGGAGGQYNAAGGSAVTSPVVQGYDGGTSGGTGGGTYPGGGGGGAGAVGVSPSGGQPGGNGGIGISPGIINATNATNAGVGQVVGSNVYFAGGGGGTAAGTQGTGGTGGGGNGGSSGTAGTPNTGGGGGGVNIGGGSGVVILRYPSAYTVSGMTQSAGSPFTEGSSKVSVFKTGTGNIQFN